MKLTENQIEVMNELYASIGLFPDRRGWCTPLELGGSNGSHHSGTLNALARKGMVQFKQRHRDDPPDGENGGKRFAGRGSKCYRLTPAGIEWIKTWREGAAASPRLTTLQISAHGEHSMSAVVLRDFLIAAIAAHEGTAILPEPVLHFPDGFTIQFNTSRPEEAPQL